MAITEKNRLKQLAAMFTDAEKSRGISSQDIKNREAQFIQAGLLPPKEKKPIIRESKIFTPTGEGTLAEFKKGDEPFRIPIKKKISPEAREKMLPTQFKKTKERLEVREKSGGGTEIVVIPSKEVRIRRFGPLDPQEQASEAQKQALLTATGKSQTQTTRQEAFEQFQALNRGRTAEIIKGLEGGRVEDPRVQAILLRLTPSQKLNAREGLERLAKKRGKASPLELSSKDVGFMVGAV